MNEARRNRLTYKRFAIVGIACLTMVGVFAAWDNLLFHFSPAAHYRKHNDSDSLWAALKNDIRNGDSVTKVEKLLGTAKRNNDPKYRTVCVRDAAANRDMYPEGFQDNDELLGYRTGRLWIHLQARDGHLVNFNPDDYPVEFNILGGR